MFEGIRFANVMSDYSISNSTMASLTPEELEKMSVEAAYAVAGASFQITGCFSATAVRLCPAQYGPKRGKSRQIVPLRIWPYYPMSTVEQS